MSVTPDDVPGAPPADEELPTGQASGEESTGDAGTGKELAIRHCDVPPDLVQMMSLADQLANAGPMLPAHLRRRPADLLAVMFAARALDVPLWTAIQSMHLVDGKVGYEATFQRALVTRAGHRFRVIERSDARAVVGITPAGEDDEQTAAFTFAEADRAGLTGKDNWRKYPRAMLVARATVIAIREIVPAVLFGAAHDPDELGVVTDSAGAPLTVAAVRVPEEVPAPPVRSPGEARALRDLYARAIDGCERADECVEIWRDARRDGVLSAPLREDGTTVEDALSARHAELAAAEQDADAETPDRPALDADGAVDAVVVEDEKTREIESSPQATPVPARTRAGARRSTV